MAKQLTAASIAAPGFYGLNTQESSITLAAGFALQADNCVIDKYGRLGARKGYTYLTSGSDGVDIKGAHEFIDINGTKYLGCWSDTDFYVSSGSVLTQVTYNGSNTITTDGWQAATLNDYAVLFHRDYTPIYFNPTTGVLDDISALGKGTPPQANTVLSAFGRLWCADTSTNKTTVYFSTLLDGTDWQTSNGELDLSAVLVKGNDEIVALGAHNGRLIIFCKNNIIIYQDGDNFQTNMDVQTLTLVDVISGVGCIARDSVQNIGDDLVFLSSTGIQSLGRVIQEKSQPLKDYSRNVRDDLVRDVSGTDPETIKSAYCAHEAFYLLLIPEYKRIYCFDTRSVLEDGSARVTVWDNQTHSNLLETVTHGLVFCNADGLAVYNGYTDDGASYTMKYYTNYFDFGDATTTKFLKRLSTTLVGGSGQNLVLKVGYDYDDSYRSFPISITSQANAEFGVAEYNTTAEYTIGTLADTIRASVGGQGSVMQVGFEATINGTQLSIQKLDIYIKQGRVY